MAGTPLCLFAEGGISRIGITLPFMRGSILLAKSAKVPIIPTFLDGVWGSVFSNQGGCFLRSYLQSFPYGFRFGWDTHSARAGDPGVYPSGSFAAGETVLS